MKPTAAWAAQRYGRGVYSIGFTTYEGSDAMVGQKPVAVAPAPPDSLEARLHAMGVAQAFLPLAGAGPLTMRIPKYEAQELADPGRAFDAVYFIDQMTPPTAQ